jgi:uncharacterized protein (TIGR03083 family)
VQERPPDGIRLRLPPLDALGDALGAAATVLRANAAAAGLEAPVPTCPGWTVRDLVAHQGMVHRWATSHLRGAPDVEPDALERAGLASPDLLGWFDDGATALLQAIVDAPDDLAGTPFLRDAPPPRLFWVRRQCHETTVHAVDALAARLGRAPQPDETWIRDAIALDGMDELLTGFVPRPKQGVSHEPLRLLVAPSSTTRAWLLDIALDRPPVVERLDIEVGAGAPEHDAVLTGEPVEVLLRLWSRGGEPRDEIERWWTDTVSVTW